MEFDDCWASLFLASSPPPRGLSVSSCSYGRGFAYRFFQFHLTATPCGSATVTVIGSGKHLPACKTTHMLGTLGAGRCRALCTWTWRHGWIFVLWALPSCNGHATRSGHLPQLSSSPSSAPQFWGNPVHAFNQLLRSVEDWPPSAGCVIARPQIAQILGRYSSLTMYIHLCSMEL